MCPYFCEYIDTERELCADRSFLFEKKKTHHTAHKLHIPDRKNTNHRSRHNTVRALALNPLKAIPHLNASAKLKTRRYLGRREAY